MATAPIAYWLDQLFAASDQVAEHLYSQSAITVSIELASGQVLRLPIAKQTRQLSPASQNENSPQAKHSPDFRSINWFGQVYGFTALQSAIVSILWQAWESGSPDVGDQYLLEESGSESNRLDQLFRGHPGWGVVIVPGLTVGTHRLQQP